MVILHVVRLRVLARALSSRRPKGLLSGYAARCEKVSIAIEIRCGGRAYRNDFTFGNRFRAKSRKRIVVLHKI